MFDFGFSELMLIAVVALVVVGPERLPKVARAAGHMLGRLQRYVGDVKSDIQREMQLEDLKKLQQQVEHQARELEGSLRGQMNSVESEIDRSVAEVREVVAPASAGADGSPASGSALLGEAPATVTAVEEAVDAQPSPQLELGLDPAVTDKRTADKA
ncbi:Sec-independent protein translocase protein TatB [Pseudothauera lacus]|uniref:Sec-independent protein translocase protein TatB n=1 Tax=Pseudothauera lacus TaxID=2136175 RepID=A0A2T4IG05_9RHOO|nr:Sec-independent protein translocase protein TatB [Pseudothauera lacus]PTD96713.1 twin-arginine translocase subunit TatB [Pseudothauera lacus]